MLTEVSQVFCIALDWLTVGSISTFPLPGGRRNHADTPITQIYQPSVRLAKLEMLIIVR